MLTGEGAEGRLNDREHKHHSTKQGGAHSGARPQTRQTYYQTRALVLVPALAPGVPVTFVSQKAWGRGVWCAEHAARQQGLDILDPNPWRLGS